MSLVPFGKWQPDMPPLQNTGCLQANNVLPVEGGFRSFRRAVTFGDEITDAPVTGSFWLQGDTGVYYNFAATENNLYRLSGNTWSTVSGSGAPYGAASKWRFARFGTRVIAVAQGVTPQYFDLGVSTTFADLPGSPPEATSIAVIRDQVVLGGTSRAGGSVPSGQQVIEWSAIDNSEIWGPSIRTQADVQQLLGRGGNVQAITPGETGYVIREHSIHRMEYVGTPVVFRFSEIARGVGTPARYSVCWLGSTVFFLGWDGFFSLSGEGLRPIGQGRVDRWFLDNCSDIRDVVGAVDRRDSRIFWAFKTSSSATYDRMLCYDVMLDAWSTVDARVDWIDEFSIPGLTLDELDTVLPGGIDNAPFFMESTQYIGGAVQIAGFSPDGFAVTFTGSPARGVIETREIAASKRMVVQGVRPYYDAEPACVVRAAVGHRERGNDNVTYSALRGEVASGEIKFRESTRYARVRVESEGAFRHALGVAIRSSQRGGRR